MEPWMDEINFTSDVHSLCIYFYTHHPWAPLIFTLCKWITLGCVCITRCYRAEWRTGLGLLWPVMILGLHIHIASILAMTLVPAADLERSPILYRRVTAEWPCIHFASGVLRMAPHGTTSLLAPSRAKVLQAHQLCKSEVSKYRFMTNLCQKIPLQCTE